ncbi:hypothetical protein [Mycolicibacterium hodleri]|uniref:Uncharacterized protein n=1 Tax=Mycolicibacterium hodleri TaxID=49897 RepID=A0A502EFL7_9MYCO|nr:hypothetical protein [Mycolicibacterium hodleri]TPG35839.1 hypothetical protein EAH80_07270 [Mycolicibacterium hodleri]
MLEDAADLYDETFRPDPEQQRPQLVSGVINGLALIGVNFSVPEGELREWLARLLLSWNENYGTELITTDIERPIHPDLAPSSGRYAPNSRSRRPAGSSAAPTDYFGDRPVGQSASHHEAAS